MSNEIQFPYNITGVTTVVAKLYLSGGTRVLAAGPLAMSDSATPGVYWANAPTGLTAGSYAIAVLNGTTLIGTGNLEWDGTKEITSEELLISIDAVGSNALTLPQFIALQNP